MLYNAVQSKEGEKQPDVTVMLSCKIYSLAKTKKVHEIISDLLGSPSPDYK